ncbi:hypothetical protein J2847_004037 [Azospirillum agricola]|uniref:hypothetical protein n=1 Tax=Azospirillum agricola TaxID=1720247 RepID=UPI001F323B73|nr:hypothetical protein [Azospirillum agricola]MBP2230732.1 hypothetical protein [Azospirillum agricola]
MSRTHSRFRRHGLPGVLTRLPAGPAAALLAGALALAGCAAVGPADNPVARKLTWFSYLNGDDLRVACGKPGADRFRMVFNADYNRHVRTYDITGDPAEDGGGAKVEARVIEATDLARLTPLDPLSAARGHTATVRLNPDQFASFIGRLRDTGAFDPPPDGLRLSSNGIYWLINGCRGGQWFFSAHPYPSGRFTDVRFLEPMRALDGTGIPSLPPLPALPSPADAPRGLPPAGERAEGGVHFEVEVADGGLVGPTRPFGAWLDGPLANLFRR